MFPEFSFSPYISDLKLKKSTTCKQQKQRGKKCPKRDLLSCRPMDQKRSSLARHETKIILLQWSTTKELWSTTYQQGPSGELRLPTLTGCEEVPQLPWQGTVREGWVANWVFHLYLVIMKSFQPSRSQSISGDHVGAVTGAMHIPVKKASTES